jgi:hypothetical protein
MSMHIEICMKKAYYQEFTHDNHRKKPWLKNISFEFVIEIQNRFLKIRFYIYVCVCVCMWLILMNQDFI